MGSYGPLHGLSIQDWQQITDWNSACPALVDVCIHDLIHRRAKLQPAATAVAAWDGSLTYHELDNLSSRLACFLYQKGVRPEVLVPLCFEKSVWAIVSILGVLKAGGAYMPLDPEQPADRRSTIMTDAAAHIAVCSAATAQLLGVNEDVEIVIVTSSMLHGLAPYKETFSQSSTPQNAAFVMFTSGSAGKPNGVVTEHRSMATATASLIAPFGFNTRSRVLQFASFIWSPSTVEIFTTLISGGCLFVPSDEQRMNNPGQFIRENEINLGVFTPSFLRSLRYDSIPSLQTVSLGGEKVPRDIIEEWSSSINLIHAYGSTETGLAILHMVGVDDKYQTVGHAIGGPSWIVDPENHDQLVPVGEVGELLLQGWNLARGYLNEEQKTQDKFIAGTAWQAELVDPGPPRFCKTGDLARYNPDGSLQIVGRKDAVIKIRGQRVDPADVEHHLRRLLGGDADVIVDAVTFADGEGTPKLVAAIDVGRSQGFDRCAAGSIAIDNVSNEFTTSMERLRSQMEDVLPSFMVPTFFIPVHQLPRLATGKHNRKRLRETLSRLTIRKLDPAMQTNGDKTSPATVEEALLCQLWSELLKLEAEDIGADDDFFRLGGDSISSMHLVSKLRMHDRSLTVKQIFQTPKLSNMALELTLTEKPTLEEPDVHELIGGKDVYDKLCQEISVLYGLDPRQFEDLYPCTPLQDGMMSMTTARHDAYVVRSIIRLCPTLDLIRLQEAWDRVVAQQSILRTRIVQTTMGSMQVVMDDSIQWLSDDSLERYLVRDKQIPMLCGDKLCRYCIIHDGKKDPVFVWTAHHALFDAWSMSMLFAEVDKTYLGISSTQFTSCKTFVKYISSIDQNTCHRYWTTYLAGTPPMSFPAIPASYRPHADQSVQHRFAFARPVHTGITTASVLRAAWALLLSWYSAETDVSFGATLNGRAAPVHNIENIAGPTITTVPVRIYVPRDQSVRNFLQNVQDQSASTIPFEQVGLQTIRRLSSDAAQACQFQTLLIIQTKSDSYGSGFLGCSVDFDSWQNSSTYALDLNCEIETDHAVLTASFDSKILSNKRTMHVLSQFEQAVQQLCRADAEMRIGDIDICSQLDKDLFFTWNRKLPVNLELCMHDMLKLPLQMFSDSVAVASSDGNLTYLELDELSTRLAHHLFDRHGVGPEVFVPICFEKTRWAVVAKLAIWKAGGAYVPIDPAYPQAWMDHIVHEIGASVVLCSPAKSHRFTGPIPLLTVDEMLIDQLPLHHTDPPSPVRPSNAAFVLYTSGTTGTPKGIVHEHRTWGSGIPTRAKWLQRNEKTRVMQFSSFSFDSAVEDIWTTLLFGGTVCLPTDLERANDLVGFMNRMEVTSAELTPSLAETFGSPETLPTLKELYLGGEPMTRKLMETWSPHVRLVNMYGPTEVAQLSHATTPMTPTSDTANVGRAQACLGWIVDDQDYDKLAPFGVTGELLVEGPTVARCYLKNEEKTRAGFVENPAWLPSHKYGRRRLYKTGDLARFSDDGTTIILGRKDTQVKIRGQRVELVQVEDQIKACLPAAQTVVAELITFANPNPTGTLTAFIAFADRLRPDLDPEEDARLRITAGLEELVEQLLASLPSYMVPSAFIALGAAQHTVTGKSDRNTLRRMALSMNRSHMIFPSAIAEASPGSKPSTSMEIRLCLLWEDVLGVDHKIITADDSFIQLGGDSIFAMKMVAIARHPKHRIHLTAEEILRHPKLRRMATVASDLVAQEELTVEAFALLSPGPSNDIETVRREVGNLCGVSPDTIQDIYPCTPLQEGIMALSVKTPGLYVSQHVYALPPDVQLSQFKTAWEMVFGTTPILRTHIVQRESGLVQIVVDEHIQWAETDDLAEYLAHDKKLTMGLGNALGRYAIAKDGEDDCYSFVWTQHHALYDGWSMGLTLDAVESAYNDQLHMARPDFNVFIKHLLLVDRLAYNHYWAQQLCNLDEAASFPRLPSVSYQPRPETNLDCQVQVPDNLPPGITLSILIRTAWALVTARYVDSSDVVFGTTLTGRSGSLRSVEDIIGPTFTTVPIRFKFDVDNEIQKLLHQVEDQRTDMMPYEHLGLHYIRKVNPETEKACRFQNLIVIQAGEQHASPAHLFASPQTEGNLSQFNVYALMVQFVPASSSMAVSASFDSNVVSEQQLRRLFSQFEHVLWQLCERAPTTRIRDIEMASPEDKRDILEWNAQIPEEPEHCIHDRVKELAALQPDAQAVCAWDGDFTYQEIEDSSSRLARQLMLLGIRPESTVALSFEKSKWAVVALLGVLKAGGAFVFLDPTHPIDRLKTILREADAHLLLTSPIHISTLAQLTPTIISISSDYIQSLEAATDAKEAAVGPSNKACLVFTSGSTGNPKGIILQHSTVCASVCAHGPALAVTKGSRVIQFANFVFDMALYEICTTLMSGGCVCIPSENERMNNLVGALNKFQINWAFFTPSTVKLLKPDDIPSLDVLVVGGEPVKQEIVDVWAERVRLFQCSGPAETTICMLQEMKPDTYRHQLGYAVGGAAWVVDPGNHDLLAPIGTTGELVMEGPVVARGYVSEIDIRRGGFIQEPAWSRVLGQQRTRVQNMFRCGDLVRYQPDGALEFMARKDAQVKLRGQRVELNEIEHHLKKEFPHDDVVVDLVSGQGRPMLAGFVAAKGARATEDSKADLEKMDRIRVMTAGLKARLALVLPQFMVPSLIISLNHLPLNGSGKIDRRRLRYIGSLLSADDIARLSSASDKKRVATNHSEREIQRLWAECLGIEKSTIGIDDSFLQIGGDSISAMRLVALARRDGLHLTVAGIFQAPMLVDMAVRIVLNDSSALQGQLPAFTLVCGLAPETEIRQEAAVQCGVEPNDIIDVYPCTALQEGLFTLSIKHSGAYVAQQVFKLPDSTDLKRLRAAFEETVAANAILRTRIIQLSSGTMLQAVLNGKIDWRRSNVLKDYLTDDAAVPIGFGTPLSRYAIVEAERGVTYLVWTLHHALYDGWSLPRMVDMIDKAYQSPGTPATGASIPPDYNKFIGFLQSVDQDEAVEFWSSSLADAVVSTYPPLPTKTYIPRPDASLERTISIQRKPGSPVTTATILTAAWSILIGRYTAMDDVVFGSTLSGRNSAFPGIEDVVGPVLTTVPVRVQLRKVGSSVNDFLHKIQDNMIRMIPFQHFGLQAIRKINPEIHAACLFQNLLVIQPQSESLKTTLLEQQATEATATFRTFPLTIICQLVNGGVQVQAKFDDHVIHEKQMARLLNHYERILQQLLLEDSNSDIAAISMMTEQDESDIWNWNSTLPKPVDYCVHPLIEEQIQRRPHSLAIHSWDGDLTYAELDLTSSKLADHLISLGIHSNSIVPLCFRKSKWTQVAILAVLRAGSAFLLLDPQHPPRRLQHLVYDAGASLVLCSPSTERLCSTLTATTCVVDHAAFTLSQTGSVWQDVPIDPFSPAYLISTSGSTGKPKTSVIEHRAYCSGATGHIPKIKIDSTSRVFQFASYAFDTCIEDILTTLIVGGCICIPSDEDRISDIAGAINKLGANWAHLTPSVATLIDPANVPFLKVLALGGEALTTQHIHQWSKTVDLINVYGPSECCVTCTVQNEVTPEKPGIIGRPVGSVAWVTERENHHLLAPIGTIGELLIEGPILARGYLGDPERTSSSFVRMPSWMSASRGMHRSNGRLYKTGDLVQYDAHGRLIYIGRKDTQVKLRGQRIELGDIEQQTTRILSDEFVDVAVEVVAVEESSSLALFIGLRSGELQDCVLLASGQAENRLDELKQRIQAELPLTLPYYMVPSYVIPLSRLPLTITKKLDRRKLKNIFTDIPTAQLSHYEPGHSREQQPSTKIEKMIQMIWSKVLNKPQHTIGVNTSFATLGGDSITAMQVLARCRQSGLRVSLSDVLMLNTISQLSQHLTICDQEGMENGSLQTGDDKIQRWFELSPMQRKHFKIYPEGNNLYQLSFLLEVTQTITRGSLANALEMLIGEHSMLRSRFKKTETHGWEQLVSDNILSSYGIEMEETNHEPNIQSMLLEIQSRINITNGPLLMAGICCTPSKQFLLLTFHHLAFDLVSWRIFLDDLEQLLRNSPASMVFSHKSLSFQAWCGLQKEYSRANLQAGRSLPFTIRPVPFSYWGISKSSYRSARSIEECISIDGGVNTSLLQNSSGTKPAELFISILLRSFAQVFPERATPTVYNVSHGREPWSSDIDISRTIGWFTTLYPIQVDLEPGCSVSESLRHVHNINREIPSNGWPFFASSYLNNQMHEKQSSVLEIAFNYISQHQLVERDDYLFKEMSLPSGHLHQASHIRRGAIFEVVMRARADSLEVHFTYDTGLSHQDKIRTWINNFHQALKDL